MKTTNPCPESRDRKADLKVLTKTVMRDLLSFSDLALNAHVAKHPDLLPLYVTKAIKANYNVDWATATEEEYKAASVWSDYCRDLFNDVNTFVETLVDAA